MDLGPVSEWNLHLSVWEHKMEIVFVSITENPVGLVMFMIADAIFVSMSKSHHHNDAADQQERARHLRLYLPRESIDYGEIT